MTNIPLESGPERAQLLEPTPEPLSDEEFGNLLAAIGNHENKSLLVSAMHPGVVYRRSAIGKLMRDIQGKEVVWPMSSGTPFGYCAESLEPVGLVTEEEVDPERSIVGYQITDYCAIEGVSLAGHLNRFSLEHPDPDFSVQRFWGGTTSTAGESQLEGQGHSFGYRVRAPLTRLKIAAALLDMELPARTSDLAEMADISTDIASKHLDALAQASFVLYESAKAGKPVNHYQVPDPTITPETLPRHGGLMRKAWQAMTDPSFLAQGPFTRGQLMSKIGIMFPDYSTRGLRVVVKHLEAQGAVTVETNWPDGHTRSKIELNEKQRATLEELVGLMVKFQVQDPAFIAEGIYYAHSIIRDSEKVRELVSKARSASPYADTERNAVRTARIQELVTATDGITATDLRERLSDEGMPMSSAGLDNRLKRFESAGTARREKLGHSVVWFGIQKMVQ